MAKTDRTEHRSTARALDILELVAKSSKGYSLANLAEEMEAPKSSLFPILQTLNNRRYLMYDDSTLRYTIGPVAYQIGSAFLNNGDADKFIQKEMEYIVSQCAETVHYGILDKGDILYVFKKESSHNIRMTSRIGSTLPAYGSSIGKALLLDYNIDDLKELYPDGLQKITDNTITDFDVLAKQLEEFSKDDITYENQESNLDIRCVGVALRRNQKVYAALSIAFPIFRYDDKKMEQARDLLLQAKAKFEELF